MYNKIYIMPRQHCYRAIQIDHCIVDCAVISIQDSKDRDRILFRGDHVLHLWFDDIVKQEKDLIIFDKKMALAIKRFIEDNSDMSCIAVHCEFGQSRSAAVGKVLSEYLSLPIEYIAKQYPNEYVYDILKKVMG